MNLLELTLGEIVTRKPLSAAILEKYNIDFCCRGKLKLMDQISNPDILKEVTKALESVFFQGDAHESEFEKLTMTELTDHIISRHHRYVKESMPVIKEHIEKIVSRHGTDYMKRVLILFTELKREMEQHMMKEEVILFPRIKTMERLSVSDNSESIGSIIAPVAVMEAEHETAGRLMEEIRHLTSNYVAPEGSCITFNVCMEELKHFEEDLHQHVHLENNILFPRAIKLQEKLSSAIVNGNASACSLD